MPGTEGGSAAALGSCRPVTNGDPLARHIRTVQTAMRAVVQTHVCDVRDLDKTHSAANEGARSSSSSSSSRIGGCDACRIGPDLRGAVQLVLSDPPYNTRRLHAMPNSHYDNLSEDVLKETVSRIHDWVRPGGHVLLFCSPMQFPLWVTHLSELEDPLPPTDGDKAAAVAAAPGSGEEPVSGGQRAAAAEAGAATGAAPDAPDGAVAATTTTGPPRTTDRSAAGSGGGRDPNRGSGGGGRGGWEPSVGEPRQRKRRRRATPAFQVESCPLLAVLAPNAWAPTRRSPTMMTNRSQYVLHATRNGAPAAAAYRAVNYRTFNAVPSRFPAHHNVIDNVVPLRDVEVLRWTPGLRELVGKPQQQEQRQSTGRRDTDGGSGGGGDSSGNENTDRDGDNTPCGSDDGADDDGEVPDPNDDVGDDDDMDSDVADGSDTEGGDQDDTDDDGDDDDDGSDVNWSLGPQRRTKRGARPPERGGGAGRGSARARARAGGGGGAPTASAGASGGAPGDVPPRAGRRVGTRRAVDAGAPSKLAKPRCPPHPTSSVQQRQKELQPQQQQTSPLCPPFRPAHPHKTRPRALAPRVRSEQKSVLFLSELIMRMSNADDLVLDMFAGTCSTAMAAIRMPSGQHRRVVCADSDPAVIAASQPRLFREFVDQVVGGGFRSCPDVTAEVVHAAREVLLANEAAAVAATGAAEGAGDLVVAKTAPLLLAPSFQTTAAAWARVPGQPCFTALPAHMLLLLANRWAAQNDNERRAGYHTHPRAPVRGAEVGGVVIGLGGCSVGDWPPDLVARLAVEDHELMRAVEAAHYGVVVAHSRVAGGTAGSGLFAGRRFRKGDTICPFYGALTTCNLAKRGMTRTDRYASPTLGALGPTSKAFSENAVKVHIRPEGSMEGDEGQRGTTGRLRMGQQRQQQQHPGGPQQQKQQHERDGAEAQEEQGRARGELGEEIVDEDEDRPLRARKSRVHYGSAVAASATFAYMIPAAWCVAGLVNDGRRQTRLEQQVGAATAKSFLAVQQAPEAAAFLPSAGRPPGGVTRKGVASVAVDSTAAAAVGAASDSSAVVAGAGLGGQDVNVEMSVRCPGAHGQDPTLSELVKPGVVALVATRDIGQGEELRTDYGTSYRWLTSDIRQAMYDGDRAGASVRDGGSGSSTSRRRGSATRQTTVRHTNADRNRERTEADNRRSTPHTFAPIHE